jgi:methionyl-tRNA formyltransferase
VTYASKLDKAEAALDLQAPAELLARRIRAFNPAPGATVKLPGIAEPVKVWDAIALPHHTPTASPENDGVAHVLHIGAEGIDIATGQGTLRLLALQRPGGKRQPVSAFIAGWSVTSRSA